MGDVRVGLGQPIYGGFGGELKSPDEPILVLASSVTVPPPAIPVETPQQKRKTLKEKLQEFADDTTAHGIPRIISRPNYFSKLFWLILVCGAFYLFGSQAWEIVAAFHTYNTKIELVTKREINFPAVTVCNLNRMARSKIIGSRFEGLIEIDGGWNFDEGEIDYNWFFDFSSDWWNAYSYYSVGGGSGGNSYSNSGVSGRRKKRSTSDDSGRESLLDRVKKAAGSSSSSYNYGNSNGNSYVNSYGGGGGGGSYGYNSYVPGGWSSYMDWNDFAYYDYSWVFEYDDYYDWGGVTDENDWQGFYDASTSEDFSDMIEVINPTWEELQEYGHEASKFILQCTFDKRKCNYTDFKIFQNKQYGNCFTFNGKTKSDSPSIVRNSSKAGSQYGLHLTLFIEQPEYIGLLTHESGVRVAIHANDIFPYPEDIGLSASTGQATAIGVRQTELTRLATPWGICSDGLNYLYESNYTYSQRSCEKKCLMDKLAERCGCITEIFPEYEESSCSYLNSTQQRCRQLIEELYNQNEIACDCSTPCHELGYSVQATTTLWPSERYEEHLYERLSQQSDVVAQVLQNVEATRKNLARVKVYFEDLNYQSIEQVEAYTVSSILGGVGGLMGLYVGISAITLVEFVVLIFDIIYHCAKVLCCRSKVKPVIT